MKTSDLIDSFSEFKDFKNIDRETLMHILEEVFRTALSKKEGVPAYIIFTDAALQDMARKAPTTEMAFLSVSGVGRVKLEKYGTRFLRVIRSYMKEHPTGGA